VRGGLPAAALVEEDGAVVGGVKVFAASQSIKLFSAIG
jgi:hypothetical protein